MCAFDLREYAPSQQIDKSTLSYAALLGIYEETGINDTQYNNLNTLFYAGKMSLYSIRIDSFQ